MDPEDDRSRGGPDDFKTTLRAWEVPAPPIEIEDELRSTFRGRRAARRRLVWLRAAASLALLLGAMLLLQSRRPAEGPQAAVNRGDTPLALATTAERPGSKASPPTDSAPVAAAPATRRPGTAPAARRSAVIVEPDQSRLLTELAGDLARVRQVAGAVSFPRILELPAEAPAGEVPVRTAEGSVPLHQSHWDTDTHEWPHVHRQRWSAQ
jgi:pyruvate/2-oxoglutarate dehydrogenase complex dihydrolipoamide acyltransferase (E2) component